MSRNTASAPFRPSRRALRGARTAQSPLRCGSPSMAATPSPAAESGALGERDLFRGSLGDGQVAVGDAFGEDAHGVVRVQAFVMLDAHPEIA